MYRHILVALDDTDLATQTVTTSIAFARALCARITFFYATPEYAGAGNGAPNHSMGNMTHSEAELGQTNAILSKALTAAAALGMKCGAVAATSGDPPLAIVEAARREGCDLIFVSSHGPQRGVRGWFTTNNTQKLLQISDLPVHVATVQANQRDADENRALAVIHGEHRSIGTALRGLEHLVSQGRAQGNRLDVSLLRLIVEYMFAFPEALHHPKEETHLFRLLGLRAPELNDTLEELVRQHGRERSLVEALGAALDRFESNEPDAFEGVASAVSTLTDTVWEHMGLEENTVLPAASKCLGPEEWKQIADSFEANAEPLKHRGFSERAFAALFTRIANRLPGVAANRGSTGA
ncbi:MAG TPA: universal stress protein [Usitatibacteraceae bacterium]|nr:universal stress protein [Usitatibacteraceae bacterium]